MHVTLLACRRFRRLSDLEFRPSPGLNIIRGGNAQGKTTVLEAILFAATTKSHRTTTEQDLAQHGGEEFHVRLEADRNGAPMLLEAHWWRNVKRFKINGVAQTRMSDVLGRVHVVFFSPDDVDLVKGGAGGRRRFLDMELSQLDPPYLNALQQYRLVLRQRNELLRSGKATKELLDVWDVQLADHGARLMDARAEYLEALGRHAAAAYDAIAGGESFALEYRPDVKESTALLETYARGRDTDLRRGQTQRGPHRDDMELVIGGKPARSFGSQGQQKTAALALKLAEVQLVRERARLYPILMLDEVLAELDPRRRRQLFEAIGTEIQCLVTTTDLERHEHLFGRSAANFVIKEGRLDEG